MARKGIPKIKIPIRPENLTIEAVEPYLPSIFQQFESNATTIRQDYDRYCLDHEILCKVREHEDSDINNIVLVPSLKALIDWKTGYEFGNPIKYAQSKFRQTNDIEYLNKYLRDSRKRSKDKSVATWLFATGVGYYFIEPISVEFDVENQAPFEMYVRNADSCTKVYSAFGGNKPLFDVLYTTYTEIDKDGVSTVVKLYDLYFNTKVYTYKGLFGAKPERIDTQDRGMWKPLPLVEKRWGEDAIGIVAMGEKLQNAVDKLLSNGLDNVDEIVNEIYVYKNVNLGTTAEEKRKNHISMKKGGAIILNANSKELPPDLDTITPKLSLGEVNNMISMVNSIFHAVIGVPMEMSGTNSGGTTKSGSEVANGYDNAYNRALDDINSFIDADLELLEKILWICKQTPQNKIDNISASDIEIKYDVNLTDNILIKAQSYNYLAQYMPPDMILRVVRLSSDPEMDGKAIEEYMQRKAQQPSEIIDVNEQRSNDITTEKSIQTQTTEK